MLEKVEQLIKDKNDKERKIFKLLFLEINDFCVKFREWLKDYPLNIDIVVKELKDDILTSSKYHTLKSLHYLRSLTTKYTTKNDLSTIQLLHMKDLDGKLKYMLSLIHQIYNNDGDDNE